MRQSGPLLTHTNCFPTASRVPIDTSLRSALSSQLKRRLTTGLHACPRLACCLPHRWTEVFIERYDLFEATSFLARDHLSYSYANSAFLRLFGFARPYNTLHVFKQLLRLMCPTSFQPMVQYQDLAFAVLTAAHRTAPKLSASVRHHINPEGFNDLTYCVAVQRMSTPRSQW